MSLKVRLNYLFVLALLLGMAWNGRAGSGSFTTYEIHEQNSLTQTGPSSFVPGIPNGTDQFSIVASVDTAGASLSAAPILGLPAPTQDIPSGSVTFPTGPNFSPLWHTGKGYNEYHWGDGYTSAAELNSVYGSGTFTFTLGDATAMPTVSLNTASPTFPISPTVTSGGTWSGGHVLIDATTGATLTFNTSSFTDYSNGAWLGAQIKFELVDSNLMPISAPAVSQYFPSLGKTDPALTSFTIAPGTLVAGQTYIFQANYNVYGEINTTSFIGTGITGNPAGFSGYLTSTFITIDAVLGAPTPTPYILWQDNSTGERAIWFMNGTTHAGGVDLGRIPREWKIASTGDFNGDGKTDIVWQDASTGTCSVWLMNGTTVTGAADIAHVPVQWQIAATADFNGDGKPDILWQNTATGERAIWLMNGTSYASGVSLGVVPTQWQIVGTGDFNGDGKTDILWQNTSTGVWAIWFMNGTSYASGVAFAPLPIQWRIAGTGDFNGDGKTDILWQNTSTGERAIWLMNGSAHSGNASLGTVPVQWEMRNH